jgi:hypothetical protein
MKNVSQLIRTVLRVGICGGTSSGSSSRPKVIRCSFAASTFLSVKMGPCKSCLTSSWSGEKASGFFTTYVIRCFMMFAGRDVRWLPRVML